MGRFRILTFNCWHGLSGPGVWRMTVLESSHQRNLRLARQAEQLKTADFDVLLLQELNPCRERVRELATGLSRQACYLNDLSGLKLAGLGPPLNMNSGQAILARPDLSLRKILGLQLSGWGQNFSSQFSLQFTECRAALFCELEIPKLGKTLVVSCHLHHGIESHPELLAGIEQLSRQGVISAEQKTILVDKLLRAGLRRQLEMKRLLRQLQKLAGPDHEILIAGDLNSDDESVVLKMPTNLGLIDLVESQIHTHSEAQALCSWNRHRNAKIFSMSEKFALPLPDFNIPELRQLIFNHLYRPRRLDRFFASPAIAQRLQSLTLFGTGADELATQSTSDHFGLALVLET